MRCAADKERTRGHKANVIVIVIASSSLHRDTRLGGRSVVRSLPLMSSTPVNVDRRNRPSRRAPLFPTSTRTFQNRSTTAAVLV